jgi:hypothetical protein
MLPTLQLSVDRIYPFVGKDGVKRVFKNINLQYNLNGRNSITTTDSLSNHRCLEMQIRGSNSIPLSTNFKLFKYFSASTSLNYEVWYAKNN